VIVEKALTIVKAYLDCGSPPTSGKATRFATWDRMVRRAIVWAGGADIGAKFDRAHELDPSLVQLREVMRCWRLALGDKATTAGEIASKIDPSSTDFSAGAAEFRKALCALINIRPGAAADGKPIGAGLMRFANRPLDGMRIVNRYDTHLKQNFWRLENVDRSPADIFQ